MPKRQPREDNRPGAKRPCHDLPYVDLAPSQRCQSRSPGLRFGIQSQVYFPLDVPSELVKFTT
jgi:hypothetical protein